MARTFFQDFTRDNGLPITVEYGVDGSYTETTYSPMFGADGGDCPEFTILSAWPRTPGHERLAKIEVSLWSRSLHKRIGRALVDALLKLDEWWRASLTAAERERMEAWIAENHIEEPDDDYFP